MSARPASCMGSEQGCLMFNCLIHLWEWLDPPVVTSSSSMEKMVKGGAGAAAFAGPPPPRSPRSPRSPQSSQASSSPLSAQPHRRPLLEQRRDQQLLYGATEPPPPPPHQPHAPHQPHQPHQQHQPHPHEHQHPHLRSPQHPEHEAVPHGYNADVHNAYLRRTAERHQIYQNHLGAGAARRPEADALAGRAPSDTELLRRQYGEIQQMKLRQQLLYQNRAQQQQQRVFAQRQLLLQQLHGLKVPSNVQTPLHHADFGQQIRAMELERRFREEPERPRQVGAVAPLSPAPDSPEASPSSASLKSPSSSEGRRSGGSAGLKSPVAQRPLDAPVAMSGWLHKQGSDGLKVWRKRWFVLADYCLFYYKNHEEDKLLGSILLPSYTVSVCSPDERVGKKFAFKCEHVNMRTYVLAAQDQDTMNKWMKTMTMASLMQEVCSSNNSQHNGITHMTMSLGDETSPEGEQPGIGQPTYANAPPKPRRSNEGYGSPSPERYDPNYDLLRKPPSMIDNQRNNTASPLNPHSEGIYDNRYRAPHTPTHRQQHINEPSYNAQNLSLHLTNTSADRLEPGKPNEGPARAYKSPAHLEGDNGAEAFSRREMQMAAERRTPDAYGRSPLVPGYYNSKGRCADYEDIYNLNYKNGNNPAEMSYDRPISPALYDARRTPVQQMPQRYTPNNLDNLQVQSTTPLDVVRRRKSPTLTVHSNTVPRPHSADFLEYEAANPQQSNSIHSRRRGSNSRQQPPRPKSSLDINSRYDNSDNFYYSEESYAEKMRQSAVYLQNKGNVVPKPKIDVIVKSPNYVSQYTNILNYENDFRARADGRSSTERSMNETKYSDSASNSTWSVRDKAYPKSSNPSENINRSNSAMSEGVQSMVCGAYDQDPLKNEANEHFMRSASARLPTGLYDQFEGMDGERKVQQREESMKRLLEWKQRMLQSPLTRKSTPSTLMLARNLNQTKLSTYMQNSPEHFQHYGGQTFPKATAKFASHHINNYNSFSSDDEERKTPEVVGERDCGRLQAGRSRAPTPLARERSSPERAHCTPPDRERTPQNQIPEETSPGRAESPLDRFTAAALDEALAELDEEPSGRKSALRRHSSGGEDSSPPETAVQRSSRRSTPDPATPPSKIAFEDFYLPMSPRKEPSAPETECRSFVDDISVFEDVPMHEDNPYVEMTQGRGLDNAFEELQTYELVCVNDVRSEPVYMEVSDDAKKGDPEKEMEEKIKETVAETKSILRRTASADPESAPPLPDILLGSAKARFFRSDGSDADDEASKDFSSDLAYSRFSLSDTFRPASYYLGPSRLPGDPQDSSDGEIVSPPPIPLEDIEMTPLISQLIKSNEAEKCAAAKKKTSLMICGGTPTMHDTIFRGERLKRNRAAAPDDKTSANDDLPKSLMDAANAGSRTSFDSDGQQIELRHSRLSFDGDLEKMLKRRPLSDESFFEIESLEGGIDESVDLDSYLDELENSKVQLFGNNASFASEDGDASGYINERIAALRVEAHYENVKMQARTSSGGDETPNVRCFRPTSRMSFGSVAGDKSDKSQSATHSRQTSFDRSSLSYYSKNISMDNDTSIDKNLNQSILNKVMSFESEKSVKISPETRKPAKEISHSRDSSTDHSAPYYYSDLSSQEQINVTPAPLFSKNVNANRKLNNQHRKGPVSKRTEIMHIHNPIRDGFEEPSKIAEAARSVSVEFLSASDKLSDIDSRNIYESSTLKRQKVRESISSGRSRHGSKNLYPSVSHDKTSSCDAAIGARTQSMSGLPDRIPVARNVRSVPAEARAPSVASEASLCARSEASEASEATVSEADKLWDEDTLWRENLRRASHRHAKSMDDLDSLSANPQRGDDADAAIRSSGKCGKIARGVTYVNDNVKSQRTAVGKRKSYRKSQKSSSKAPPEAEDEENDVYVELAPSAGPAAGEPSDDGAYERLVVQREESGEKRGGGEGGEGGEGRKKFEIDREKLRQWDLMSSGLMKKEGGGGEGSCASAAADAPRGPEPRSTPAQMCIADADTEASMSTSAKGPDPLALRPTGVVNGKPFTGSNPSLGRAARETIPVRAVSPRIRWTNQDHNSEIWNQGNQPYSSEENWSGSRTSLKQPQQPVRVVSPRVRRLPDNDDILPINQVTADNHAMDIEQLLSVENITAGQLLGRTHEELVLLLIQLRRRHVATANSIEQTALHIHNIKENLGAPAAEGAAEKLRRLEALRRRLQELERRHGKSEPLLRLLDNMVRLGELYRRPPPSDALGRLEHNQRLRERLLSKQQEDQRRWAESLSSLSAAEIQERVDELWSLHRQAAGEAATLRSLQRDHLFSGVRSGIANDPLQDMEEPLSPAVEDGGALEADLSRVHMMLAQNSKKLEQTVEDNARLERELMALRQKLHKHRHSEPSQNNNANNNFAPNNSATALLEDEVSRVQALVSHLQSQRQLLAAALRSPHAVDTHSTDLPLSERVQTNVQNASADLRKLTHHIPLGVSPSGHSVNGVNGVLHDIGNKKRNHSGWMETDLDSGTVTEHPEYGMCGINTINTPLYVETSAEDNGPQNPFGNLTNVEKQEIKTVRIVKRESERRQRERSLQPDWSAPAGNPSLDRLMEEDFAVACYGNRTNNTPRNHYNHQHIEVTKLPPEPVISPLETKKFPTSPSTSITSLADYGLLGKNSPGTVVGNGEVSPIFKSEAARQILLEMSGADEAIRHRRAVPKAKRRHYTAPHHLSANTLNDLNDDNAAFYRENGGRSLDDADLERALRGERPREVVRAAAAPPAHFSSATIDRLLAAPGKILIPERYVPERAPDLSPEEEKKRREKVESIRKMLTGTSAEPGKSPIEGDKKQREHILQLNQILAKQVMEMSKIVAIKAMERLPLEEHIINSDESSPEVELPIYQQRYNYFS